MPTAVHRTNGLIYKQSKRFGFYRPAFLLLSTRLCWYLQWYHSFRINRTCFSLSPWSNPSNCSIPCSLTDCLSRNNSSTIFPLEALERTGHKSSRNHRRPELGQLICSKQNKMYISHLLKLFYDNYWEIVKINTKHHLFHCFQKKQNEMSKPKTSI